MKEKGSQDRERERERRVEKSRGVNYRAEIR